ncbi:glycosyltransferase [Aerococcus sp. HMSC10H05]|uniref:glycosyltransferase n=1 Tax=Aerococcus sp. HMSC10H05 TaxID=1581084 RepID=UPI0008A2747E|nr:glycosyltransferase [Aerococcus sp. HMSC10H05]OFU49968.1 hypothetical protein HMPREF3116_06160 [Aerococcus sp. HMSC10H05]
MKICFVSDTIGVIGGQQKILTIIANSLAQNKKNEISILFNQNEKLSRTIKYPLDPKVKTYWTKETAHGKYDYILSRLYTKCYQRGFGSGSQDFNLNRIFPLKERRSYIKFFETHQFDIIVGVAPYSSALLGMISNQLTPKTVGWLHNSYERYFEYKDNLYNLKSIYKIALKKLDSRIVLTKSAKRRFTSEFDMDFDYIYNPLTFKTSKFSTLKKKKIIFVGRIFYATKGLDLLLEIVQKLKKINSNFEVEVVGDGPDMQRFQSDIEKNNLQSYITIVGESNNVAEHYLDSSIFISTSKVEGFGLVLTEAMECGLPVVSFSTEGPSEIIIQNKSGFLVNNYNTKEFAEKLDILLKNDKLRSDMGAFSKQRANDFSLKVITEDWETLFNSL